MAKQVDFGCRAHGYVETVSTTPTLPKGYQF